jgi:hypothetical protein
MRGLGVFLFVAALGAQTVPLSTRDEFGNVASLMRAFPPDSDYVPAKLGEPARPAPGLAEYHALMAGDHPVQVLLELFHDPDPKVRTLAAAALAAKGDPRLLEHLRPLLDDRQRTFDVINGLPDVSFMAPSYGEQTVAQSVLGLSEKLSKEDFDQYWAAHTGRAYCADWFLWQFRHREFAAAAREKIAQVSSPDRELIMLWIGDGKQLNYTGYSEEELVEAAKRLGRERVLAILDHHPPGNDPDIAPQGERPRLTYQQYIPMMKFLLNHAGEILSAADAGSLAHLEEVEQHGRPTPWEEPYGPLWPVALASVQPGNAAEILDRGEERYPHAWEIALARWRILGESALPAILRWFYASPVNQQGLAWAIVVFKPNEAYRPLVAAILDTPQHSTIDGQAIYQMVLSTWDWGEHFDSVFADWIFAQPPDANPATANTPAS